MMNKRGESEGAVKEFKGMMWAVFVVGFIFFTIALVSYFMTGSFSLEILITEFSIREVVSDSTSFSVVFGSEKYIFFDYVFGRIPTMQIDWTNPISAAIIVIGIWLLLFLTFGDIISMFSTFNKPVSWLVAFILAVIAANISFIMWIAAVGLVLTAGLGTLAIIVDLLLIFFVFLGFNFGSHMFQQWVVKRRIATMQMRASMGGKRAMKALEILKEIEKTFGKGE